MTHKRILVIRLGALGDIVLSCGPFQAIRNHHKSAHITLLTTQAYSDFLKNSNWFDEIIVDHRPKVWQIKKWWFKEIVKLLFQINIRCNHVY